MKILTVRGLRSSGRTTVLLAAVAALARRAVRLEQKRPRVLVIGPTQRAVRILTDRLLADAEGLGITGRDPERGCFILDGFHTAQLPDVLDHYYDMVAMDDVEWVQMYRWAKRNQRNIGHLFATEDATMIEADLSSIP